MNGVGRRGPRAAAMVEASSAPRSSSRSGIAWRVTAPMSAVLGDARRTLEEDYLGRRQAVRELAEEAANAEHETDEERRRRVGKARRRERQRRRRRKLPVMRHRGQTRLRKLYCGVHRAEPYDRAGAADSDLSPPCDAAGFRYPPSVERPQNYMTPDGAKRLVDELRRLVEVERPKVVPGGLRRGGAGGPQRERRVHLRQETPSRDRSPDPVSHEAARRRGRRPKGRGTDRRRIFRSDGRSRGRGRQARALHPRGR